VTTELCGSGTGCVTISLMILNRVIRRYGITNCVVKSHLKFLPLCDYKVWINIERDAEAKCYLHNMVELNMMKEEFRARKMAERKHTGYFAMKR
jgi:hypothetical protein